jgi:Secretion system C-terminal sorting domain
MRSILLLCIIFLSSYAYANAQITVTNATFPKAGDTLRTSTVQNLKGFTLAKIELGKNWDFSNLKASKVDETILIDAKKGVNAKLFPTANLVEKRSSDAGEYYILSDATKYQVIGYDGLDPTGVGIATTTKVSPALTARRAPMNYLDINNTNFAINAAVPLSALPDSIQKQLGAFAGLIDSLRIKYVSTRTDVVDGYGTMKVPMGTYSVLRERRVQYNDKKLEVHTKLFKAWSDITALVPLNQLPATVKGFIGTDTTLTYNFFSNTQKEPIAIATMSNKDNTVMNSITFKNVKKFTPVIDLFGADDRPDVRAFPNPATEEVNIEMSNLSSGTYTLKIYNLLGAVIWQESHVVSGGKTVKVDISRLRKGSYLYSVSNAAGKILATKRLMVMKA